VYERSRLRIVIIIIIMREILLCGVHATGWAALWLYMRTSEVIYSQTVNIMHIIVIKYRVVIIHNINVLFLIYIIIYRNHLVYGKTEEYRSFWFRLGVGQRTAAAPPTVLMHNNITATTLLLLLLLLLPDGIVLTFRKCRGKHYNYSHHRIII